MRDGVHLHTNIISPAFSSKTKWPVVIDRSPYGGLGTELLSDIFLFFDFVAIGQDMRGTCKSEGNFSVFHSDTNDGADTIQWILKQDWCDGNVYEIGASADGIASFELALASPDALKAQFIIFATAEARRTFFPGGAYRYGLVERWLKGTVPDQAPAIIENVKAHEGPSEFWTNCEILGDQFKRIKWPSVMWGGWYDIFQHGNIYSFDGYQHRSDPSVRGKHYFVVDPLGHCQDGAEYFPKNLILGRSLLPILLGVQLFTGKLNTAAELSLPTYENTHRVWDPKPTAAEGVDHVTFYVMSSKDAPDGVGNYWTTLPDWPQYTPTPYYFHRDGTMSTELPGANGDSTTYTYDPANPTPSIGGNNLEIPCGASDQRPTEARDDTLVFSTGPLEEALAVTGPLRANLFVSAAQVNDTDFAVKITDVYPDGTSQLLQDGIQRMRWREGPAQEVPLPMKPDEVYNVNISLWNTSYVFSKGHQIRIVISSANYPRFEANPNTGVPLGQEDGQTFKSDNTVYHSAKYPSSFYLPVVKLSDLPKKGILDLASKMADELGDERFVKAAQNWMDFVTNKLGRN
jgi:hypothetical protein